MPNLTKLTPDPISFSVVEVRFSSKLPVDVFFGMIYNKIKDQYPTIHKHKGNNLGKIYPKYALLDESFAVNIGSNIISFASIKEYLGWKEIFSRINDVYSKIDDFEIFDKLTRIGLRYINFFEDIEDISEHVNINLQYNFATPSPIHHQIISSFSVENDILCTVNIQNNVLEKKKKGSIIDIDCSFNDSIDYNLEQLLAYIDKCHNIEKDFFGKVIKEDFLNRYNPQYK